MTSAELGYVHIIGSLNTVSTDSKRTDVILVFPVVSPPQLYQNQNGSIGCLQCGVGTYSLNVTLTLMVNLTGKTSETEADNSTEPAATVQITYLDIGNPSCSACDPGTYSSAIGASACVPCDYGYVADHFTVCARRVSLWIGV